jgi:predicted phosphodiesterase
MRLAVLSDIHGNLVALETVLADLAAQGGADITWCLGDLAVFGSRPVECIRRIKTLTEENEGKTFKTIGGNTDRYLVNGTRYPMPSLKIAEELEGFVHFLEARDTIMNWNLAQLTWEDYEFLKKIRHQELSLSVEGFGDVIGYHAVPGNDEPMLKPDTPDEEAADYLLDREGRLGIGGHTHIQMNRHIGRWQMVNVGSVGLSVDNPGYAQYGIFTFGADTVTVDLRNIPYDVDAAVDDLYAIGHPVPQWIESRIRPEVQA